MLTKNRYSLAQMMSWSRWELALFIGYAAIITVLIDILGFSFIKVPWTPVALIGTAVAFIVGFQNNAAYGRIWEARKIWGGIVNTSRTWGMQTRDMISNEHAQVAVPPSELQAHYKTLVYRHIAWMTALRHAMRTRKSWESFEDHRTNREWSKIIHIPEKVFTLEDELFHYLSAEEWEYTLSKNNKAAALLFLQSKHLKELKEAGLIWQFAFLDLEDLLEEMFNLQGKSERIKNFPYPRQYATLSYIFTWIFIVLLPIGVVPQFADMGAGLGEQFSTLSQYFIWLGVPFCATVSWVFHTMQRIGTVGENPFEGSANDVPISTIARGIEIDLRQLMDEDNDMIPKQFPEEYNVQM
jgi:putative membrane protein